MKVGTFILLALEAIPWKGPQIKKPVADKEMATRQKWGHHQSSWAWHLPGEVMSGYIVKSGEKGRNRAAQVHEE